MRTGTLFSYSYIISHGKLLNLGEREREGGEREREREREAEAEAEAEAFQLCFPTGYTVVNIRKRLVCPHQVLKIRQENR
jgi:hypothetical protein